MMLAGGGYRGNPLAPIGVQALAARTPSASAPGEITLSVQVRENCPQLVAQFGASCGAFAASRERAEERATRWLCWQSEANSSLPAFGELQGDLAQLQGQCLHIQQKTPCISVAWMGFSLIRGAGRP